jgi:hypothetical protein
MAADALSRAGDFHVAQFLGSEGSRGARDADGYVPEEYFHAGRHSFSRKSELAR